MPDLRSSRPSPAQLGLPKRLSSPPIIACAVYFMLRLAVDVFATYFEVSPGISLWYPACGLALSLMIFLGPRYAPVVLAANVISLWLFPAFGVGWGQHLLALLTAVTYAAAAWTTRRFLGPILLPTTRRATIIFTFIVVGVPAVTALSGSGIMLAYGMTASLDFWRSALYWWVGDVSGLLTVVPVAMVFGAVWFSTTGDAFVLKIHRKYSSGYNILQAVVLLGSLELVFAYEPFRQYNLFYLCFLPLIWICFCHGLPGATLATLAITMTGLVGIHFSGSSPHVVVNFLLFELATACVGLGLGAAVTRRDKVASALITSEAETERLLQVIEATTDFVVTTDGNLCILYANAALLRQAGRNPLASLRGHPVLNLFSAKTVKTLQQDAIPSALASSTWHGEVALLDGPSQEIPVSLVLQAHRDSRDGALVFSFVLRNITRQKQAEVDRLESERRLLQVQKLESLGVLAGGIAHDFNNLLTPLLGCTSLARLDLATDSPVHGSLDIIEQSTKRAATLCQQMLAYAGRTPTAFSDVDLSSLIEETAQLLQVSTGSKHSLKHVLVRPLPLITADPGQIRQALMNLVLNASEAIGKNQGEIVVRTRAETFASTTPATGFQNRAPEPGHYVVLEVEDNGSGMTPEVEARMFEPFFTTKFSGHGLGLAAVLGISKSHNGAIQVKSEPGRGTIFRLFFPALAAPAKEPTPPTLSSGPWRGSGTVLVVDDEPAVRNVIARTLEVSGFTTQRASDGLEALEYFKAHSGELRLVLLDLTMPRMDGEQAFHEMNRINPSIPVILMSGYSQKLTLDRFAQNKPAAFLSKPFDHRTLQTCLRQLPTFQNG
jgi:signal transduction histidine kinase